MYLYILNSLLKFVKIKFFRDIELISSENFITAGIIFVVLTILFLFYINYVYRFMPTEKESIAPTLHLAN